MPAADITKPNMEALIAGLPNLQRHIENMKNFGQSVVVSFNRFKHDTDEEVTHLNENFCEQQGVVFAINNGFTKGRRRALQNWRRKWWMMIAHHPSQDINFTYDLTDSIKIKIEKIAKKIYRAGEVVFTGPAAAKLASFEKNGWGNSPVCIAKTQ